MQLQSRAGPEQRRDLRTFFENQSKIDQLKIYTVAAMCHKSARGTAYGLQPVVMLGGAPWPRKSTLPAEFLFAAKISRDCPHMVDLWLCTSQRIDQLTPSLANEDKKAMLQMYNKISLVCQNEIVCVGLYLKKICDVENKDSEEEEFVRQIERQMDATRHKLTMKSFPKTMHYACALYNGNPEEFESIYNMMEYRRFALEFFSDGDPPVTP